MFLINSSVGSFAAAPSSLNTKVRVQKNIINHDLLLISENFVVHKKGFITHIVSLIKNETSVLTNDISCFCNYTDIAFF